MISLNNITYLLAQAVRAHRESRGLSIGQLAEKAEISKTSLSKIEAGSGNPSLEVMVRIAQALNVSVGALLTEEGRPGIKVIRQGEGQIIKSDAGMVFRLLYVEGRNRRTEVSELILDQSITYSSLPHPPGTEELVVCIEGALRVGPQGQEVWLQAGEAIWFPADLPHSYESQTGAKALLYMSYPPALGTPY